MISYYLVQLALTIILLIAQNYQILLNVTCITWASLELKLLK